MKPHDAFILLPPFLLHFLKLGLAHDILDARSEMAGHSAHSPNPIADGAHDLWQVLGADEDQREDRDDR
jgi:hypothetical protein